MVLISLLCLLLIGCTAKEAEKVEDNIKTLDDLKEAKAKGEPTSEIDKCLKEAKKYEIALEECRLKELSKLGYDDGLDCVYDYENPDCEDNDRYNADVEAGNICIEDEEISKMITQFDCMSLIG